MILHNYHKHKHTQMAHTYPALLESADRAFSRCWVTEPGHILDRAVRPVPAGEVW